MTEYLTEQEQVEILKNWIKQYSMVILSGVVIAVVAMSGWRYWQQRQNTTYMHASAVYDEMLNMRAQNDTERTLVQAQKLFTHYPKTTYGQLAALMLARDAVVKKDYTLAKEQLNWVLDHSKISALRQIARLRLARVALAEKNADESLKILSTVEDPSYSGLIDEIRGDALLSKHDVNGAREAYKLALTELPNAEVIRPLLQMKYDNLANTTS